MTQSADLPDRRRFRPMPRRRTRLAVGLALCAVAVGGNVLVYTSLGDKSEVIQVTNDVPAGERITSADLRAVAADVDPTVPVIGADELAAVVGQFARVHLVSGALLSSGSVQPAPLVTPGRTVVAVEVRPARIPSGLRERSRVLLIVPDGHGTGAPLIAEGRVVAHTRDEGDVTRGDHLSLEIALDHAATVAAADDVRVALLEPDVDPAMASGGT